MSLAFPMQREKPVSDQSSVIDSLADFSSSTEVTPGCRPPRGGKGRKGARTVPGVFALRERSIQLRKVNEYFNTQLCLLFGLAGRINCVFRSAGCD